MEGPGTALVVRSGAQDRRFATAVEPFGLCDQDALDLGSRVVDLRSKVRRGWATLTPLAARMLP